MDNKFILANDETTRRIDLDRYKISFSCNSILSSELVYPREESETWDAFSKRVNRIVELFDETIFHSVPNERYKFITMPACYSDYLWARGSEFSNFGSDTVASYSIGNGLEGSTSLITTDCYNSGLIKSLFNRNRLFTNCLFDLEQYITAHSNTDTLSCKVWLARTAVGNRRNTIENEAKIGDSVLFNAYNIGDYISAKSFYPISDKSHFLICTQSRKGIGDIDFGRDLGPEDEGNHDNAEYWAVYAQLITDGSIAITNACISQIIPHGSVRGRKLKPLVEVKLSMKQVAPINRENNCLFPKHTDFVRLIRKTATMMRQLAVLDYNRKCDIINGIIADAYSVKQILPDTDADLSNFRPLTTQPIRSFSLLGINLSFNELRQFWNVFSPLYSAIQHEDYTDSDFVTPRFVRSESMLFMLEMYEDSTTKSNGRPNRIHTLTVFKKKLHRHRNIKKAIE